jgi:hypothetical protein
MKHYFLRYFLVAFAAILLVAGSTRVLARAGATPRLADVFQVSSSDSATETAVPTETVEPTETLEPTETDEPTETAEPTEVDDQDDDDQGQDENQDDSEFSGTVEQISADAWVVSGVTVLVTSETEIEDGISVGDAVKVEGTPNPDGTMTAHEIQADEDSVGGSDDSGSGSDDSWSGSDDGSSGSDDGSSGSDDGSSGSDDGSSGSDDDDGSNSGPGGGG